MKTAVEDVPQRTADQPLANRPYRACVTPAGERLAVSRRARACAITLALLLGYGGAAAAEGLMIGGTGAALGSMRLLANEFTAGNPGILVTTVPSNGQWIP